MRPSDTTAGTRRRNDSPKRTSSKERPTDKQRRAVKTKVKKKPSGKHPPSRSLVKRKGGSANQPLKDARPPSRSITPSVLELNWRMFDAVLYSQLVIALGMAFASLSLGAIGIETAYLFVMAVLLAACTAPGLYYLYRNDIEAGVTAFSVLQLVSASCSLMVCAVAIFGHDYADFSVEERAYYILIFVIWQYACVVGVCYKPYSEVSMKDLKARVQRLRGQKQKESRDRSSSSATNAPRQSPAKKKTDHVVVRMEPQQQVKPERVDRGGRLVSKTLSSATQNQGAKIGDTKAKKITSNVAIPLENKVATAQTSKLDSSKSQPATATKDSSTVTKTSARPVATSVSDVDVAMKQITSPCRKTLCPSPVSSTYADSTFRP
ncbi:hypothetical protein AAVH_01440 [Aphelenchoides avenae]|nr:hypothetical protein AAVH_01440 [Aphelenchus avenae]